MASRKPARTKTRKPVKTILGKQSAPPAGTLATVVGPETYAVWVEMLKTLVPYGRTHRLSVVVAGMLRHAANLADRGIRGEPQQDSVAASLLTASEGADSVELAGELGDVLARLFHDAEVSPERVSARGQRYSIIDSALQEFVAWDNMPWE